MDHDELVAGLRKWAAAKGDADKAAVELLAWHGFWLRRADFRKAAIRRVSGDVIIRWGDALAFAAIGPRCSSSERAVLRLAVMIGGDELGLSGFGHAHRRAVVRAFATAMNVDVVIAGENEPPRSIEEILGLEPPEAGRG